MNKRKLVLGPLDSEAEFNQKFLEMFNIDFDTWCETANQHNSEEIFEWEDGKIFAGGSAYDMRIKVYT